MNKHIQTVREALETSGNFVSLHGRPQDREQNLAGLIALKELEAEVEKMEEAAKRLLSTMDADIPGSPGSPLEDFRTALRPFEKGDK